VLIYREGDQSTGRRENDEVEFDRVPAIGEYVGEYVSYSGEQHLYRVKTVIHSTANGRAELLLSGGMTRGDVFKSAYT
jgi:hypothetical protein